MRVIRGGGSTAASAACAARGEGCRVRVRGAEGCARGVAAGSRCNGRGWVGGQMDSQGFVCHGARFDGCGGGGGVGGRGGTYKAQCAPAAPVPPPPLRPAGRGSWRRWGCSGPPLSDSGCCCQRDSGRRTPVPPRSAGGGWGGTQRASVWVVQGRPGASRTRQRQQPPMPPFPVLSTPTHHVVDSAGGAGGGAGGAVPPGGAAVLAGLAGGVDPGAAKRG